jgi:hypothetical protein
MLKQELFYFPSYGYILQEVPDNVISILNHEINEILNNFKGSPTANSYLAGNLRYEFQINQSKDTLERFLLPLCIDYDKNFNYLKNIDICTKSLPLRLDGAWVNFQRKYEFNPNHCHNGIFSFVIWVDIPYDIEQEKQQSNGALSNSNCPGFFEFSYIDNLGKICNHQLEIDRTFNNKCIIFPSRLVHTVYPFYTSDNFRISVSGNILLRVD